MTTGTKHDQNKPAYHLIDAEFCRELEAAAGRPCDPSVALGEWATGDGPDSHLTRAFWGVANMYGTDAPTYTARLELARVLAFGAKKYAPNNWRGGFAWSRLWRAAYGHIQAHRSGDIYDPETGFLHLSHALCCLMFLIVHARDGLGRDDRAEVWPTRPPLCGECVDEPAEFDSTRSDPEAPLTTVDAYGVDFDLQSAGATLAVWRCRASRAMLLLGRDGGWRWEPTIKPTQGDVNSARQQPVIARLRAAAWPSE